MFETKQGTIKPIVYIGFIQDHRLLLVDYSTPPNPTKSGWWIPAPGLAYGEDPQETAESVAISFGFTKSTPRLKSVESFVTPGGWHLIYHYICEVSQKPTAHENVNAYKWVTLQELESMKDIAHGKWEIGVGKSYLEAKP